MSNLSPGDRLGELLVLSINGLFATCLCDCGKECNIKIQYILRNNPPPRRNCGHDRYEKVSKAVRKEMVGKRFGMLVVLEERSSKDTSNGKKAIVLCRCDCGTEKEIESYRLRCGSTKSCGCDQYYKSGKGNPNYKHGLSSGEKKHPLFTRWAHIRERCYRENHPNYAIYGGKGVIMEEPWYSDAQSFIDWYERLGGTDYSLDVDRVDPDGNYSPDNCRLVTRQDNNRNRTNNKRLTAFGVYASLAELVELFGKVDYGTVQYRLASKTKNPWTAEEALTLPPNSRRQRVDRTDRLALIETLSHMKQRCSNPNHPAYQRYGERGITVCAEWMENSEAFYEWSMANGFEQGKYIDRIDNDKGYSPANCRWTTAKENNSNRG